MCTLSSASTATATPESSPTGNSIPAKEKESPPLKPAENGHSNNRKMKRKKTGNQDTATTSQSSLIYPSSSRRSPRLPYKRRNTRVLIRHGGRLADADVEAAALPLGMSFAATVAQVMGRKDAAGGKMGVDQVSKICSLAVRESLANVFGNKFDFFARNFEKSFDSTLKTLTLVNEESLKETQCRSHPYEEDCDFVDCYSEPEAIVASINEEVEYNPPRSNQELCLYEPFNQLQHYIPSYLRGPGAKQLSTIEKSVVEQTRANDLKMVELSILMRKLKIDEDNLSLTCDSNNLRRSKLAMGESKASFKAEKFKSQLEDTRHAELLRKCIDCLVAGLFIMSVCILYGAYVFSYQRITDATTSCNPAEESKAWWIPSPVTSINSGWHTLKCQVLVASRMLFGVLIILAVAYLLLRRSASSRQTMPITFILLLLGAACGLAGKFCVDTLGGSSLLWLIFWETFLFVQFLSNVCTSMLYSFLHGPLGVSQGVESYRLCPYWLRRLVFYGVLLILPMCCGLLPFGSPGEWKDHFFAVGAGLMG